MQNIWTKLLETAIHAPSPHNVQPWRVKIINETEAELYIDSRRTLPKEDITGSFIILTMGLFIEALSISAEPEGFRLSYELFHEPDWYAPAILETKEQRLIPFTKLKLTKTEIIENNYSKDLFFKRRTSRLNLLEKSVPDETVSDLQEIANAFNQKFSVVTDTNLIEKLMDWNTQAVFEDLNSADYHDEIVEWFRYSDKQSRRHLDGLDYRCMNTPRLTLWMSAKMSWLMRVPVSKQIMAKIYRAQLGNVPTLGVIAGGFWKPSEAIDAGRFLMRFWLETAVHNLYIHPYGNLVTNRKIAESVEKELGISDVWLVFKIGYSAEPSKSYRLPVERILV